LRLLLDTLRTTGVTEALNGSDPNNQGPAILDGLSDEGKQAAVKALKHAISEEAPKGTADEHILIE